MIGLVLAGGKSVRFGRDKATFTLPGMTKSNVQLAIMRLRPFCEQVVVCVNETNDQLVAKQVRGQSSTIIVHDQPPFAYHGPLSAVYTATKILPSESQFLMTAVDYPFVSKDTISRLARHPNSVAATTDSYHYTLANFRTSNRVVTAWLRSGNWRLGKFIVNSCRCHPLYFDKKQEFINLNYYEGENNEEKGKHD